MKLNKINNNNKTKRLKSRSKPMVWMMDESRIENWMRKNKWINFLQFSSTNPSLFDRNSHSLVSHFNSETINENENEYFAYCFEIVSISLLSLAIPEAKKNLFEWWIWCEKNKTNDWSYLSTIKTDLIRYGEFVLLQNQFQTSKLSNPAVINVFSSRSLFRWDHQNFEWNSRELKINVSESMREDWLRWIIWLKKIIRVSFFFVLIFQFYIITSLTSNII